jgi:hypothetical protein
MLPPDSVSGVAFSVLLVLLLFSAGIHPNDLLETIFGCK